MIGVERQRARSTVLESFGDFWCEAAVLVAVFAILGKLLKHERLTWAWAVATVGCATIALMLGILLTLIARGL